MGLIYGKALQFNGSTQYAVSAQSKATAATDNFSMTAWIYALSLGTNSNFVFQNGAKDAGGFALFYDTGGTVKTDFAFVATVNSAFGIGTGIWYHIGVIRNSGTSQMYINGTAEGTSITNSPNSRNDYITVGAVTDSNATTHNEANVIVDDARIYTRAITVAEIGTLYSNGNKWPYTDIGTTSLYAYYKFDEGSGGTASDSSGNAITLTNTGTPSWVQGIVATGATSANNTYKTLLGAGNI